MTIKEAQMIGEIAEAAEKYIDILSGYYPVSFDGDNYYEISEPKETYDGDGTYTVEAIKEDEIDIDIDCVAYKESKRLRDLMVYYPVYNIVYSVDNKIIDVRDRYDSVRHALKSQPCRHILKTGEALYKWMNG